VGCQDVSRATRLFSSRLLECSRQHSEGAAGTKIMEWTLTESLSRQLSITASAYVGIDGVREEAVH